MLQLSPVTLEVVRHALLAIAEEMSVIVMRAARSPLLKEAGDLSSALTDARGRLVAQGRDIPIHLGVMAFTVKEFLARVPRSDLHDGDVYFTNLPEVGGNHLPDVKAIRPVFVGARLCAFAVSLAHWADIGGAVPGSYVPWASEAYQEGLRLSPIKVFDRRGPTRAFDLVMANVRGREEREGDCRAQFAAVDVAARRLGELFRRYGVATTIACFERLLKASEQQMRAALKTIRPGVYAGEDWVDDDGHDDVRVPIRVAVTVRGDRATFDFTGTGATVKGPINTTPFVAASAVYYSVKSLVGPDVPANDGAYRPIAVEVPPDTILNPAPGAPVVGGNHETSQRVVDACYKALAAAIPERITAGGPTTSGLLLFGTRRAGRWHILYEVHGGGEGGGARRDGGHAVRVHMSNVMNTPTEVIETEYPMEILHHALRPGSGGAGRQRGGCGLSRAYRVLAESTLTTMLERRIVPPWGAFGGADGAPFRITLERDGTRRDVKGKETLALRAGDVVLIETSGGGGYGDAAARPAELTARDRLDGYIP
jgi:N-methylhydantoinase B